MERFKKGTKVVCVDSAGQEGYIEVGQIYISDGYGNEKDRIYLQKAGTGWFYSRRFLPVSEIEPFAVRFEGMEEFNILDKYGKELGCSGSDFGEYPTDRYFIFEPKQNYYSTTTSLKYKKTLTFEQFKNNEHIMNAKEFMEEERRYYSGGAKDAGTVSVKINVLGVSPEFVKEAHRAACADWKKKIEDQFPSLFPPTYKLGDKFKIEGGKEIYILIQIDGRGGLININTGRSYFPSFKVSDFDKIHLSEIKSTCIYDVTLTKI